jgi:SAM-dependent methyltransferase
MRRWRLILQAYEVTVVNQEKLRGILMTKVRMFSILLSLMVLMAAFAALSLSQTANAHIPAEPAKDEVGKAGNSQIATTPAQSIEPQPPADKAPVTQPLVHFEGMNPRETWGGGDKLALPRQIAAAVVAQDNPSPKLVVDVGSHQGEFLEAFLEKFPAALAQWTEPVDESFANAKARFARFGDRVTYRIGCPSRDISDGCVPKNADVIITSWVSAHQDRDGIARFYRNAAAQLPSGGWLVNMDHIGFGGNAWEHRFQLARLGFHAVIEGPSPHGSHAVDTLEEHLAAFKAAGIDDVQVVWQSFNTVLFMGRKR